MNYDQFIGQVQSRARVGSTEQAIGATRATLQVLGERLFGKEAEHLAAQLPGEIGLFLKGRHDQKFGLDEFLNRVSKLEGEDLPVSIHHARAVMSVLKDAVTAGEWDDVLAQLEPEYDALLETGSEGDISRAA